MMDNWEVDPSTGKRFRRFGRHGIEYEMEITTTAGTVPESRRSELLQAQAEASRRDRELKKKEKPLKLCPLREMRKCSSECTFYDERGCGILTGDAKPGSCPLFSVKCSKECALYEGGCNLFQTQRRQS